MESFNIKHYKYSKAIITFLEKEKFNFYPYKSTNTKQIIQFNLNKLD